MCNYYFHKVACHRQLCGPTGVNNVGLIHSEGYQPSYETPQSSLSCLCVALTVFICMSAIADMLG